MLRCGFFIFDFVISIRDSRFAGIHGSSNRQRVAACMHFVFVFCIVDTVLSQRDFFRWVIRVTFTKESQLQQSRATQTLINYKMHAGSFRVSIIHRTLAMDYRIFNVRT